MNNQLNKIKIGFLKKGKNEYLNFIETQFDQLLKKKLEFPVKLFQL